MKCVLKVLLEHKPKTSHIHFQYEKGATIRATEAKPKLDKFLISKKGGVGRINENWFVNDKKSPPALNYKMRFVANGEAMVKDESSKKDKTSQNKKKAVYYKDGITMYIICFIPELLEMINNNIKKFFEYESFGARQKRHGKYEVKSKTITDVIEEEG